MDAQVNKQRQWATASSPELGGDGSKNRYIPEGFHTSRANGSSTVKSTLSTLLTQQLGQEQAASKRTKEKLDCSTLVLKLQAEPDWMGWLLFTAAAYSKSLSLLERLHMTGPKGSHSFSGRFLEVVKGDDRWNAVALVS